MLESITDLVDSIQVDNMHLSVALLDIGALVRPVLKTLETPLRDALKPTLSEVGKKIIQPVIGLLGLDLGVSSISIMAAEQSVVVLLEGCDLTRCSHLL